MEAERPYCKAFEDTIFRENEGDWAAIACRMICVIVVAGSNNIVVADLSVTRGPCLGQDAPRRRLSLRTIRGSGTSGGTTCLAHTHSLA
jgi:hypothetical protein